MANKRQCLDAGDGSEKSSELPGGLFATNVDCGGARGSVQLIQDPYNDVFSYNIGNSLSCNQLVHLYFVLQVKTGMELEKQLERLQEVWSLQTIHF